MKRIGHKGNFMSKQKNGVDKFVNKYKIRRLLGVRQFLCQIMLPKQIELKIKGGEGNREHGSRDLFKDGEADLYLMIRDKIFPVKRSQFSESRLISEQLTPTDKFCLLEQSSLINESMVETVLTIFYGNTIYLSTLKQLEQTLNIIDTLQIDVAKNIIEEEILHVFSQYDVFFVLNLAHKHCLSKLYRKCFEQLLSEEFQQMLYNKYDLMQCDFKLLQIVLHKHKILQIKGKISGVLAEQIEEILKLYCAANHYDHNTYEQLFLKYGKSEAYAFQDRKNTENQKRTLKVQAVSLNDLARKDGVKSNIYDVKEDKENGIDIEDKKIEIHNQEGQSQENQSTEKSNPNNFPFRAITRPTLRSTDRFLDNTPVQNVKKRVLTRRMSEHIDSLGLEKLATPQSQPLNEKINRSVNLEELDEKSDESIDHGASVDNNFQMKDEEDADTLQVKISHMLDRYENAFQEHDKNFQLMRENCGMKSVMINNGQEKKHIKDTLAREFEVGKKSGHRIFPSLVQSIFQTNKIENSEAKIRTPRD